MYDIYNIRALREDHDLTQAACAKALYVSKNTYIRYETGERIPPFDFMIRLADYYNVSLDYLAGRTQSQTQTQKS